MIDFSYFVLGVEIPVIFMLEKETARKLEVYADYKEFFLDHSVVTLKNEDYEKTQELY